MIKPLVADLSPWTSAFDPRPIHVGFMVGKMAMGKVSFRALLLFLVSIIPPILHTHFHFRTTLIRMILLHFDAITVIRDNDPLITTLSRNATVIL